MRFEPVRKGFTFYTVAGQMYEVIKVDDAKHVTVNEYEWDAETEDYTSYTGTFSMMKGDIEHHMHDYDGKNHRLSFKED